MAEMEEKDATTPCVDAFLAGVEKGSMGALDEVFASDAVLDATVPNWRFSVRGEAAIRTEMARWYADPGRFEELERTPLPDGELVEFALAWTENGVPHAVHQAHRLRIEDGRITRDTAWCGGRWPAGLLADMQAAAEAAG
jgi:hypothetical protein